MIPTISTIVFNNFESNDCFMDEFFVFCLALFSKAIFKITAATIAHSNTSFASLVMSCFILSSTSCVTQMKDVRVAQAMVIASDLFVAILI